MDLLQDFAALNARERLTTKYPLYSQDDKRGETLVVAKYFFPASAATWYVFEAGEEGGDITFFGLVTGLAADELGYFTLNQLASVSIDVPCVITDAATGEEKTIKIPTCIERDLHFTPDTLANVCPDFVANLWHD